MPQDSIIYLGMTKLLFTIVGGALALIPVYLLSLVLQNALEEKK
jgi:asparagine N-glycosylation enzyme membrane subunit Stt3|tara:strand:+ start:228 stop:359 length:132 start_codon:yes stop_codon:yes gene_type:complete